MRSLSITTPQHHHRLLLLCLTLLLLPALSHAWNISFTPSAIAAPAYAANGLVVGEATQVVLTVDWANRLRAPHDKIRLHSQDESVCAVDGLEADGWLPVNLRSHLHQFHAVNLTVRGVFLGKTSVCALVNRSGGWQIASELPVNVVFADEGIFQTHVATALMMVVIVVNTFALGTQMDVDQLKQHVRHPIGPAVGLLCQYLVMPLLSLAFGWLLLRDNQLARFGLFVIGCSPGGSGSNFWTLLVDGNLDLSMTMTFVSICAALGMMPLWLWAVTSSILPVQVVMPFRNIILSLVGLVVPTGAGLLLVIYKPDCVAKIGRFVKAFTAIVIVAVVVVCLAIYWYMYYLMTWRVVLCGVMLPWCGFLTGYTIARLLGQEHYNAKTIAIETGIQNIAIAFVICKLSLPSPDAELAQLLPGTVALLCSIPLWLWVAYSCYERRDYDAPKPQPPVTSDSVDA